MSSHLPVKEWPESERPREKLAQLGPEHLSDAELLAILLRVGSQGQDAVGLSQNLLVKFEGLANLSHASLSDLRATKGIGLSKAVIVSAALELGRRMLSAQSAKPQVRSPADVVEQLQAQMSLLEHEQLFVVLLNTKNRVLGIRTVYKGSLNTSLIRTGEVFQEAIKENAAAIIIAHNHPSGDPTPSVEDGRVTSELVAAGRLLDIDVLDHLVIGHNSHVSLRKMKLGFD